VMYPSWCSFKLTRQAGMATACVRLRTPPAEVISRRYG
jgi:hypothetical protein